MAKLTILGCITALLTILGAISSHADTLVERGAYLMNGIVACGNCHNTRGPEGRFVEGMELAGGMVIAEKPFTALVPNITPDMATGIGAWSNAEIITAIRDGRRPDGSLIGPPMPFSQYRDMSDSDVKAIVAYLRQVPAVANKVGKSEYRMELPPAWGPPVGSVADVSTATASALAASAAVSADHSVSVSTSTSPSAMPSATSPASATPAVALAAAAWALPVEERRVLLRSWIAAAAASAAAGAASCAAAAGAGAKGGQSF